MIGLDTNILVRYLTQDDSIQSPKANKIIDGLTEGSPGFISIVALVETTWVLARRYALSDPELARVISMVLRTSTFEVQNEREVFTALALFESGLASFTDALIGELGGWAGCTETLTFDRKAARLPAFKQA